MSGPAEKEPQPIRTGMPEQEDVFPKVHSDLEEREAYGMKEYGGPLVTNDGRNNLWDAYQESLDLAVYLRKEIMEREQSPVQLKVLMATILNLEDELAGRDKLIETLDKEVEKHRRLLSDLRFTLEQHR